MDLSTVLAVRFSSMEAIQTSHIPQTVRPISALLHTVLMVLVDRFSHISPARPYPVPGCGAKIRQLFNLRPLVLVGVQRNRTAVIAQAYLSCAQELFVRSLGGWDTT